MSEWVKTRDQPPPLNKWILMHNRYDYPPVIGKVINGGDYDPNWYAIEFFEETIGTTDLHKWPYWMPLPEPPKEDKE